MSKKVNRFKPTNVDYRIGQVKPYKTSPRVKNASYGVSGAQLIVVFEFDDEVVKSLKKCPYA